ncbi:MAG: hypothetical protein ACP5N2_02835 [Candidatus Nanoarchaeia archaeon]
MSTTNHKKPKSVEEDLSSINEEDLLKENKGFSPRTKKILGICAGAFLVILTVSLIFLQGPMFNIVAGQIESRSVNNNFLELKDFNVVFSDAALLKIKNSYLNNPEVETSLCLIGVKQEHNYFISDAYTPIIFEQSFRHVSHEPCNSSTIMMFHTHPYKSCLASSTDLNTLKRSQLNNPDMLTIIMCEPNRFSVYD